MEGDIPLDIKIKQAQDRLQLLERKKRQSHNVSNLPQYLQEWTVEDVSQQLSLMGLEKYNKSILEHRIDGRLLASGNLDKSDLLEIGFSGMHAAKFLAWVHDCQREGGVVEMAGSNLTEEEMVEAVKCAFQVADTNGDVALSRQECLDAASNNMAVTAIFENCPKLKGLTDPALFDTTFDSIDMDKSGYISVRELLIAAELIDLNKISTDFASLFHAILTRIVLAGKPLNQIKRPKSITQKQLFHALTLNAYGINDFINQCGKHTNNPLMRPKTFKKSIITLLRTKKDGSSTTKITFRNLSTFCLRKEHGGKRSLTTNKKKDPMMSTVDRVLQKTMSDALESERETKEEIKQHGLRQHRRLIHRLQKQKTHQKMANKKASTMHNNNRISNDGSLSNNNNKDSDLTTITSRMNVLEGLVRSIQNHVVGNPTARAIPSKEAMVLRALANNICMLEDKLESSEMRNNELVDQLNENAKQMDTYIQQASKSSSLSSGNYINTNNDALEIKNMKLELRIQELEESNTAIETEMRKQLSTKIKQFEELELKTMKLEMQLQDSEENRKSVETQLQDQVNVMKKSFETDIHRLEMENLKLQLKIESSAKKEAAKLQQENKNAALKQNLIDELQHVQQSHHALTMENVKLESQAQEFQKKLIGMKKVEDSNQDEMEKLHSKIHQLEMEKMKMELQLKSNPGK